MQDMAAMALKPVPITFAIVLSLLSYVCDASIDQLTLDASSRRAIEDIHRDSQVKPAFLTDIGERKLVNASFRVSAPARLGNDPVSTALWAIEEYAPLFKGLSFADLSVPTLSGAPGNLERVVFLQEHKGLKVFGAGVVVGMVDMGNRMDVVGIRNETHP